MNLSNPFRLNSKQIKSLLHDDAIDNRNSDCDEISRLSVCCNENARMGSNVDESENKMHPLSNRLIGKIPRNFKIFRFISSGIIVKIAI